MPRLGRRTPTRPGGGPHPAAISAAIRIWTPRVSRPQLIAVYQVNSAGSDTSTLTTPSFTPQAGEILAVKALGADRLLTFGTPTGGGWTYTSRGTDVTISHVSAAMWTAPVLVGGTSQTVAVTAAGTANFHTIVVERWAYARVAASPALTDQVGSGAPSATNTTVQPNSVVTWCAGDWAAVNSNTTRVYRSDAYETGSQWLSGFFTGYWAYQYAVSPGAQTVGLTAPAGQTWTLLAVELQFVDPLTPHPISQYAGYF